jgi:hypothetical protein
MLALADKISSWRRCNLCDGPFAVRQIEVDLTDTAKLLRPLDIERAQSSELGRPNRDQDDALILDLAIFHRQLGGSVAVCPSSGGPFTQFLREVWKLLPRQLLPAAERTFLNRAQALLPIMRRQEAEGWDLDGVRRGHRPSNFFILAVAKSHLIEWSGAGEAENL